MSKRPPKNPQAVDDMPTAVITPEALVENSHEFAASHVTNSADTHAVPRDSRQMLRPTYKPAVERFFIKLNARLARQIPLYPHEQPLQPARDRPEPPSMGDFLRRLELVLDDNRRMPYKRDGERPRKGFPMRKAVARPLRLRSATAKRRESCK